MTGHNSISNSSTPRKFQLTEEEFVSWYSRKNSSNITSNIKPYFIGIDTETFQNGNLLCLCNSENHDVLFGSSNFLKLPDIQDVINYLRRLANKHENTVFVTWNLAFDAQVLLKTLGSRLEEFIDADFETKIDNIKIKYLNKKCLQFTSGKKKFLQIYDTMQLYRGSGENGSSSLDSVAKVYIGKQKEYDGLYQDKKFPDQIDESEMKKIVEYCHLDCKLTKELMNVWVDSFHKNFSYYPDKYYSAGYIASGYLQRVVPNIAKFLDVPFDIQKSAYGAYFGGRFEIFKRGHIENVYHYDIRSAYPYAMSLMPDIKNGYWQKITKLGEIEQYDENQMGFYEIDVTIKERNFAPFMFRGIKGNVFCPSGRFKTSCTHSELVTAIDNYSVQINNISGWFFHSDDTENRFNKIIMDMYKKRTEQKNSGQKYIYKVLINSIYGKFAQSRPQPGILFNPVYCSYITGFCRSMLLKACAQSKESVVMVATDGIFSTSALDVLCGERLGDYEYSFHPKMDLVQAGVYATNTLEKSEMEPKTRGFGMKIYKQDGTIDKLSYDDTKLEYDKDGFHFFIKNLKSVTLKNSHIQDKYSYKDISKMEFFDKKIYINADLKRRWLGQLKSMKDLNNSITIQL